MKNDPGQSSVARLVALRQQMQRTGTDVVAISPSSHMEWLIGARPLADERPCLLLITQQSRAFVIPALNLAEMRVATDANFYAWSDHENPETVLTTALDALGGRDIGAVAFDETMRADCALLLLNALPKGVRTTFASETLGFLRTQKSDDEIGALKDSASAADGAITAALGAIRPGITESDLAEVIRAQFRREGASPLFSMVASGPNSAQPHHATSDRLLREGEPIAIDIGARKSGFPSDITRMAFIGAPSAEYIEVHRVVENAVQAALTATKPGVTAQDIDAAARNIITEAGYGEFFTHRTGHGMGIDLHERPFITASNDAVLQQGNVFSIEPGIYLPGRFGVRLEEIVVMRASGPEILSHLSRDLQIVAAAGGAQCRSA